MLFAPAAALKANHPDARASWLARVGLPVLLILATLLAGCGLFRSDTEEPDETVGWSVEQLYRDAKNQMASGNWPVAITQLERIQARYPFGIHAQQAMIDMAYSYWRDGSNEQALATIERFQQQYPNHPATDYMLYLKGLVTFTPPSAFMSGITRQDPSERDPKGLRQSYDAFRELIERFPQSRYADDARKRQTWLVNTIAMNEVHVARYYYERGAYVAAVNRAQTVITDFEGAPAAEEALYIMMLSYDKLGMPELRDDARRVLLANYPDSRLLKEGFGRRQAPWWDPTSWF